MLKKKSIFCIMLVITMVASICFMNGFSVSAASAELPISSVTASADDGNVPANTIDNNLATRWSASGDGQWINFDLGSAKTVDYIEIAWYSGDVRRSTFDIQVSTDNTNFSNVYSGQSSGTTTALEKFDFTDVNARYVRIVGHGNTVNAWNSITEVNVFGYTGSTPTPTPTPTITVSTASQLTSALSNAKPGDVIVLKPGTYAGNFTASNNGTSAAKITLKSESATSPAILKGPSITGGYVFYLTGDYWIVQNIKVETGNKGIMLDNANYNVLDGCEVYNIGGEAVHFRDGSSNNTIKNSKVHDTGKGAEPGMGEGIYIGSDNGKWATYAKECDNNKVQNCVIGPNVTGEHIDIKEGTTGTLIENCTFNGTGICGLHYADSFIDAKGNNAIIRYNTGYRNGNSNVVDAFQVHQQLAGWGLNNDFNNNTLYLDNSTPYVVNVASGSAKASQNTRSPSGNMYKGAVTQY